MWGSDAVAMRLITHACCYNGDLTPLLPQLKNRKLDLCRVEWDELPAKGLRQVLSQLSACCTLTLNTRNAEFVPSSPERLRLVMKHVRLISKERYRKERLTRFSEAILRCGSPRIVRHALQTGIIVESTKDILIALQESEIPLSDPCREALLTTKRDPALVWDSSETQS